VFGPPAWRTTCVKSSRGVTEGVSLTTEVGGSGTAGVVVPADAELLGGGRHLDADFRVLITRLFFDFLASVELPRLVDAVKELVSD
jgi:hypothetical protein